jgi:excinuclease ABC subunit C
LFLSKERRAKSYTGISGSRAYKDKMILPAWKKSSTDDSDDGKLPGNRPINLGANLIRVDGGKGQLGRAADVLRRHGLAEKIPVVGLAKGREEIYPVDQPDPIILPRRSQGLYLVQRIRDEAHRFALRQHQRQRRRSSISSKLDEIQGIGPVRKRALIQAFGDLNGVKDATIEDIAALPGISEELAGRVKESL